MEKIEKSSVVVCGKFTPVKIDQELCKGCGLCVDACPKGLIKIESARVNKKGYHPAQYVDPDGLCVSCAECAIICPDVAIEIRREVKG